MKKQYIIPMSRTFRLEGDILLQTISSPEIHPADPSDPIPGEADSKERDDEGWGDLW